MSTYKTYKHKVIEMEKEVHNLRVMLREEQERAILLNGRNKKLEHDLLEMRALAEKAVAQNKQLMSDPLLSKKIVQVLATALEREYATETE